MVKRIIFIFLAVVFFLSGCATVPRKEVFPTYAINGTQYLALIPFCQARGINWEYDTFTRTMVLSRDTHKVNLMAGQTMVLVDGAPQYLKNPVELHEGTVAVPYKFKAQILDDVFKAIIPFKGAAAKVKLLGKIKKVVIDAGHGGNDPGAIGRTGLREKHVNLDIAKRLAALLKNEGLEVVLTRGRDESIPLSRRAEIANNAKADIFISVHSNANRVRSLNGFEVYYISSSINDQERAFNTALDTLPDLEGSHFASASQDLKATLWDMIYTYNRAASVELAQAICKAESRDLDTTILGVKNANFQVLRATHMPAVLIEVGFLSNSKEERLLKNNYYRQKIAENITEGILNYAGELTLASLETE